MTQQCRSSSETRSWLPSKLSFSSCSRYSTLMAVSHSAAKNKQRLREQLEVSRKKLDEIRGRTSSIVMGIPEVLYSPEQVASRRRLANDLMQLLAKRR